MESGLGAEVPLRTVPVPHLRLEQSDVRTAVAVRRPPWENPQRTPKDLQAGNKGSLGSPREPRGVAKGCQMSSTGSHKAPKENPRGVGNPWGGRHGRLRIADGMGHRRDAAEGAVFYT